MSLDGREDVSLFSLAAVQIARRAPGRCALAFSRSENAQAWRLAVFWQPLERESDFTGLEFIL